MNKRDVWELQGILKIEYPELISDGVYGPRTKGALFTLLREAIAARRGQEEVPVPVPALKPVTPTMLAWGAKVSQRFRVRVVEMAAALGCPPEGADWLMACMAWETAETFSPSIRNRAGSGATGLIQFMPATARALGTTVDALSVMSALDQLEWVYQYFFPYRNKMNSLGDVYSAILWPRAVGKPDGYVLWDRDSKPVTYRQNIGLDLDRDGVVTKREIVTKVRQKLDKGMRKEYQGQIIY